MYSSIAFWNGSDSLQIKVEHLLQKFGFFFLKRNLLRKWFRLCDSSAGLNSIKGRCQSTTESYNTSDESCIYCSANELRNEDYLFLQLAG